eukprot:TRINITY_DN2816_c0_g1_i1.p1 TRINITY_DN2816_c0_g1~~TRINITY_DN2816_c0_g1_i1.p1  ORF type:complete len:685 (+),score=153.80 TRINITY_DN2816_c0_g1_i1:90-2144(+)
MKKKLKKRIKKRIKKKPASTEEGQLLLKQSYARRLKEKRDLADFIKLQEVNLGEENSNEPSSPEKFVDHSRLENITTWSSIHEQAFFDFLNSRPTLKTVHKTDQMRQFMMHSKKYQFIKKRLERQAAPRAMSMSLRRGSILMRTVQEAKKAMKSPKEIEKMQNLENKLLLDARRKYMTKVSQKSMAIARGLLTRHNDDENTLQRQRAFNKTVHKTKRRLQLIEERKRQNCFELRTSVSVPLVKKTMMTLNEYQDEFRSRNPMRSLSQAQEYGAEIKKSGGGRFVPICIQRRRQRQLSHAVRKVHSVLVGHIARRYCNSLRCLKSVERLNGVFDRVDDDEDGWITGLQLQKLCGLLGRFLPDKQAIAVTELLHFRDQQIRRGVTRESIRRSLTSRTIRSTNPTPLSDIRRVGPGSIGTESTGSFSTARTVDVHNNNFNPSYSNLRVRTAARDRLTHFNSSSGLDTGKSSRGTVGSKEWERGNIQTSRSSIALVSPLRRRNTTAKSISNTNDHILENHLSPPTAESTNEKLLAPLLKIQLKEQNSSKNLTPSPIKSPPQKQMIANMTPRSAAKSMRSSFTITAPPTLAEMDISISKETFIGWWTSSFSQLIEQTHKNHITMIILSRVVDQLIAYEISERRGNLFRKAAHVREMELERQRRLWATRQRVVSTTTSSNSNSSNNPSLF